jgi:enoyl-CoA hydratase/carnithine racemase
MENSSKVIYEDENFVSYKTGKIGIIKIKNNVFNIVTDLPESSNFFHSMEKLENDVNVAVFLLLNEKGCLGTEEYELYLKSVFSHKQRNVKWDDTRLKNYETRTRQLLIINILISKIIKSKKIVISGFNGEIVSPFFGVSLAADLRLTSEDTVYILKHSKLEDTPAGALPYFLPKYLGFAKSTKILFSSNQINVKEALELDLLNGVLSNTNYEEKLIEFINKIYDEKGNTFPCLKRILNYNFRDIAEYLKHEECDYIQW